VRKIADAISAAEIPSRLSYSAGAYVCNELLYSLLAHFDSGEKGRKVRVGFIHVPYIPEQGKTPSMSLDDIKTALKIAIENLDI
jgi:pyroglutamyl-peptidase